MWFSAARPPVPPKEAAAKVSEYIAKGCTTPILYPLGPDVPLMIDTFANWSG